VSQDLDELAQRWISYQRSQPRGGNDSNRTPSEVLLDMVLDEPDRAWEVIVKIHEGDPEGSVAGILAAGPLEDLLASHGAHVVDRVVTRARQDPRFREVLRGVWLDGIDTSVAQSIEHILGPVR
jgi:uncharacterized protein DUF6869